MSRTQLYRDSFGRVRLEISSGAGVVNSADTIVLLMPNPYAQTERLFLVDDVARTVEKTDFHTCARLFNASTAFSIPTARRRLTVYDVPDVHAAGDGYVDDLGERQLAGVTVRGVRFTSPTTKQVDERWESEELGLVIHARHTDPHVEIEYRVDNVERRDPPQRQFVLPADYALLSETYLLLDPPLWKRRY